MSTTMSYEQKRDAKVRRALVRLKYSLMADKVLYDMDEAIKESLKNGEILKLDMTLKDITDETG